MGCDIHGFVEVKFEGKWYVYDKIPLGTRNYALFGFIAGVRDNSVQPVSRPKGLPNDATEIVKAEVERWGNDGHSHTWLSREEMNKVYQRFEEYTKKEKNTTKDAWLVYGIDSFVYQLYCYGNYFLDKDEMGEMYKDVRMIIWFDN